MAESRLTDLEREIARLRGQVDVVARTVEGHGFTLKRPRRPRVRKASKPVEEEEHHTLVYQDFLWSEQQIITLASGTTTVSHGLGRTPNVFRITQLSSAVIGSTPIYVGTYTASNVAVEALISGQRIEWDVR